MSPRWALKLIVRLTDRLVIGHIVTSTLVTVLSYRHFDFAYRVANVILGLRP
jgi:hypothetical protein